MNESTKDDVLRQWRATDFSDSGKLEREDIIAAYDAWSTTYDQDNENKYYGPLKGAKNLARLLDNKTARIMDCACGTGLVGKELRRCDFTAIDGADLSMKSLDKARSTGCYQNLYRCDVEMEGFPCENDTYDAIVCVGTFIGGHINQSIFPEFIRIVKPGGFIVIVMREQFIFAAEEFKDGKLDQTIARHAQSRDWTYISRQRFGDYLAGHPGIIYVFKVL